MKKLIVLLSLAMASMCLAPSAKAASTLPLNAEKLEISAGIQKEEKKTTIIIIRDDEIIIIEIIER